MNRKKNNIGSDNAGLSGCYLHHCIALDPTQNGTYEPQEMYDIPREIGVVRFNSHTLFLLSVEVSEECSSHEWNSTL